MQFIKCIFFGSLFPQAFTCRALSTWTFRLILTISPSFTTTFKSATLASRFISNSPWSASWWLLLFFRTSANRCTARITQPCYTLWQKLVQGPHSTSPISSLYVTFLYQLFCWISVEIICIFGANKKCFVLARNKLVMIRKIQINNFPLTKHNCRSWSDETLSTLNIYEDYWFVLADKNNSRVGQYNLFQLCIGCCVLRTFQMKYLSIKCDQRRFLE